jgi:hypothetical protein
MSPRSSSTQSNNPTFLFLGLPRLYDTGRSQHYLYSISTFGIAQPSNPSPLGCSSKNLLSPCCPQSPEWDKNRPCPILPTNARIILQKCLISAIINQHPNLFMSPSCHL